ncbi:MAG: phosphoribosylamine--glycine ligase [Flavobacteriales bacterium]
MKVLILGSGAREHALGWKIAQSSQLDQLYFAPGNPGTGNIGENLSFSVDDRETLLKEIKEKEIRYLVVGPEDPIVEGIRDDINADPELEELTVIAPNKAAARLEGSKAFAKSFMERHSIPTAAYGSFSSEEREDAQAFLGSLQGPYVVKVDGLAAGKGVSIHDDIDSARQEVDAILKSSKFGEAGQQVVIEEFLDGAELSVFALCDGTSYKLLPEAKDYKRIGEGDTGPNTGGMGAVSPVPFMDKVLLEKVEDRIVRPTLEGAYEEGMAYQGFLFFGLMIVNGEPYVVEYNVRMGDPEAQVVLPRMDTDLLDLFEGIATGTLSERDIETDLHSAVSIVLASGGYPGKYEKGKAISGLGELEGSFLFQAGTSEQDGALVTAGGRVLTLTALGRDLESALTISLADAERIGYEGRSYRRDIGQDLLKKEAKA